MINIGDLSKIHLKAITSSDKYISGYIDGDNLTCSCKIHLYLIHLYTYTLIINTLISEHQNKDTSLLLICGDFNAKVGTNNDDAECVGRFSRGHRNVSGQCLIDFCNAHKLFITNSAFKHKAAHITTWESTRINKTNNTIKHIYNQIN